MSDFYVVIQTATTYDESSTYVTKDSTELIELAWSVVDANSLEITHKESVLVRPVNTPITPYCTKLYDLTWENVRDAGSFKDAISKLDTYIQKSFIQKELDFSLVTFDIRKLRVQLLRESRDKSVVLPAYLQHPRIFDLQLEYSKWQATHPESLSYSAQSLSNIATALEVENLESITSGSSPSPLLMQQSLFANSADAVTTSSELPSTITANTSKPSRTSATVQLFSEILVQLAKRSLPITDHSTVLTRPYDSAQDARVFLAERSKILYLSNLATDTTQSELESWFSQYGGRPISFWTLQNLDSADKGNLTGVNNNNVKHSRSIAGFAVFATHEEAADSLSMNGRALNDRAIEVQPSSTRVLDKATDLLTPFPPLKNRPRPGDWTCPSCGFSNFQRRTHCFRCSFPASSAVAIQESMYTSSGTSTSNGRRNDSDSTLTSTKLQLSNSNSHSSTGSVHSPNTNQSNNINANNFNSNPDKLNLNNVKSTSANSSLLNANHSYNFNDSNVYANSQNSLYGSQSHSNVNGNNSNLSNNTLNSSSANNLNYNNNQNNHHNHGSRSHYGNNVPFRAGDWKCDLCMYHNFAKNLCCLKCAAPKPVQLSVNNHQNSGILSVNSTAAAIAAATASGQPLNMSNGFMGLQQPQPLHASYGQSRNNSITSTNSHYLNSASSNSNQSNNSNSNNSKQNQYHYNNLRGSGSGTPQSQIMPQQLMMLQQLQLQQLQLQQPQHASLQSQKNQSNQFNGQQKYGQSNSPNLYNSYVQQHPQQQQQQQQQHYYNKNNLVIQQDSSESSNPAFNVLANQMNSLSLNH